MSISAKPFPDTIVLFDVDGTLTPARKAIKPDMKDLLKNLRSIVDIGFVGGSDFKKQKEQLGDECLSMFDYCFSQNGLKSWKDGEPLHENSMLNEMGEDKIQMFINFCLAYLSKLKLPAKRGTFIEWRTGMLNISPVGRACSQKEREEFLRFDLEHKIRPTMIEAIEKEFPDIGFTYSIGGQISFDVFPTGWDKTYCLQFVETKYKRILFFGDKTYKGGNDFEIFTDKRTEGHSVTCPEDTAKILNDIFGDDM